MSKSQNKPLKFWSLTIGGNFHELLSPEKMDSIFTEFCDQWVYQGEYGDLRKKKHYQCRLIMAEPQMKCTLLRIFNMRGIPLEDMTFGIESNKSIEQGGLAFYVMDSTKDVYLPPRHDPQYKPHRSSDWLPDMVQTILDNPRPWEVSILHKIEQVPDHRKIIWICTLEGKGGVSKSLFNTYLEASGKACWLGDGTPIQLKEGVINWGEYRCYTCDMPMTFAHDNRIGDYINAIETVKNGFIKTSMHGKPKRLIMNERPHVIVFSNTTPPWESMTSGRFEVYTIDPDQEPDHQTLDPYVRPPPQEFEQFQDQDSRGLPKRIKKF